MKKIVLLLITVLMLSMTLSSCGIIWQFSDPADAEELWERIDKQMGSLRSYSAQLEADYSYDVGDTKMTGKYVGNAVYVSDLFGNLKHAYESSEMTMQINGEEYTAENLIAYDGGWMYIRNGINTDRSSIRSAITREEFEEFLSGKEGVDYSPRGAENTEIIKNEDSTVELICSGFGEQRRNEIAESFGFAGDVLGVKINDVKIHTVADRWFRVTEISVEIFADSAETPVACVKASYGDFNKAKAEEINPDRFNEVDDARVVDVVYDKLQNVFFEDEGKVSTSLKQKIIYNAQPSEAYMYTEADEISFTNKDGSFSFRMVSAYDGNTLTTEFKDGIWKTYSATQTEQAERTDAEARSAITSIINAGGYERVYVRDVEKVGEGKYRIVAKMQDDSQLERIMESMEDTYVGHDFYFDASIEDGELTSLEGKLIVHGALYTYELTTLVSFDTEGGINNPSEI